jgi:hypothetical protein
VALAIKMLRLNELHWGVAFWFNRDSGAVANGALCFNLWYIATRLLATLRNNYWLLFVFYVYQDKPRRDEASLLPKFDYDLQ